MVSVVGVDLGVHKVALAAFEGGELVDALAYEVPLHTTPDRGQQLHILSYLVHDFCLGKDADSVWMEDVLVGNNRKYSMQLAEVKGAVLSGLYSMTFNRGTDVRLVNVQTWKKEVIGNGNATKDMIKDYVLTSHSGYAALCGADQDLYDASCIGLYGLTILGRAASLKL